jgi:CBS domain containing-hemolysin-like protein
VKRSISPLARWFALVVAALMAPPCFAASGEFADKVAHVLALFIIIVLPIGGVVLFWLVHILPEKAAEKRHHPQKDAIQVLCLLSLVFGGLLWPLAWLWAYSKPVIHKLAYGRDKHDDYYAELEEGEEAGTERLELHEELAHLRHEVESLEKRDDMPAELQGIRERLAKLEGRAIRASTTAEEGVR